MFQALYVVCSGFVPFVLRFKSTASLIRVMLRMGYGCQKKTAFRIVFRIAARLSIILTSRKYLNIFSRPYEIIGFVFFRCQELFSPLFLKNYSNPGNFIRLKLPPSIRMKTISFLLKPSWSVGL